MRIFPLAKAAPPRISSVRMACLRGPRAAVLSQLLVSIALVAIVFGPAPVSHAQAEGATEYGVKAAFLYNFTKFIEWPPRSFSNDKSPINLCIFGDDPFDGALDEIVQGKTSNNRSIVVRRLNKLEELKSCQLVFLDASEDRRLSEVLDSTKGRSELVVGEGSDFARRGGDVQFFLENSHVHFAINVDAIQRSGLTVSSRLLALARVVHDGNRSGGD